MGVVLARLSPSKGIICHDCGLDRLFREKILINETNNNIQKAKHTYGQYGIHRTPGIAILGHHVHNHNQRSRNCAWPASIRKLEVSKLLKSANLKAIGKNHSDLPSLGALLSGLANLISDWTEIFSQSCCL